VANHDSGLVSEQFLGYRSRAALLVRTPADISALALRATQKLGGSAGLSLSAVREELASLIALLRAYADGSYRRVSSRTLTAIGVAVLYFVSPLDLVPDFILGLGLLDDAAVIGYVFNMVRNDVREFVAWQRGPTVDNV
jgi:uncharacterized membrane protein YkvA (DUF1232 family)